MALTEQEIHCVTIANHYLSEKYGGEWAVERDLDELFPAEPSPEVLTTNGTKTAAIEVKRLITDAAYIESLCYFVPHNVFY